MNSELEDLTKSAIKDLEDAIAKAKGDITRKLDSKSTETTSQLKDAVSQSTKNIQTSTQELANKLVMDSKLAIQNARKNKVDNARSKMDDIVSNINK